MDSVSEYLGWLGSTVCQLWGGATKGAIEGIGWIVVGVGAALGWVLFRYLWRLAKQAASFVQSRQRTLNAVGRAVTKDGPREGKGVWLTTPIDPPDDYKSRLLGNKILAVANLKGGVGKTTLTANLGVFFAKEWGKRVLLIDLDFQGSLSSMAFPDGSWVPGPMENSRSTELISNDIQPNQVAPMARQVDIGATVTGSLKVITAYYDLAQADNRLLVEWLLRPKLKIPRNLRHALSDLLVGKLYRTQDVRYTLAEVLLSDAVRSAFDLIIIDCPPRLTTSEIQAFCTSTHLLVPTIFDRPSAEAVGSLCDQVETLKKAGVCPYLEYVGVVGTKWRADFTAAQAAIRLVQDALEERPNTLGILPPHTFLPMTQALVNDADEGIAYLVMGPGEPRDRFDTAIHALADVIAGQMGLPRPKTFLQQAAE